MIYAENILICILIPLIVSLLFTTGRARQFVIAFCVGMLLCLLSAYVSGFTEVALGLHFCSSVRGQAPDTYSSRHRCRICYI